MKKYLVLLILFCLVISGCGKKNEEKVLDKFTNQLSESDGYYLKASMDINNEEDTFNYDVEVTHKKDDYYKVFLKNNVNNHEQIILKNMDGVYVVTPSLNKSFKFQSDWPKSSSQSYLLESINDDITKDEETSFTEEDGYYVYTAKVNYPNNVELKYEKVYFDKNGEPKMVKVYNNDDIVKISVTIKEIDFNKKITEEDFKIESLINDDSEKPIEETGKLEDIIYPLYIPSDTYLKSKETVLTDNGDRVILTFAGSKNFVLVEEASKVNKEFEIIPVYGEPLMLSDTIGAMSANSLSWSSNNVDYYLTSNDLTDEEFLTVAHSLNVTEMVVGK